MSQVDFKSVSSFSTKSPLLRPVGILQMAIKMHEVCWKRGEELRHLSRKTKPGKKKAGRVSRQACTPRTEEGAEMRATPPLCTATTDDVHLVIYLTDLRCISLLCHTSWHLAVKSNALWMSSEYHFSGKVRLMSRVLCHKLYKQMN